MTSNSLTSNECPAAHGRCLGRSGRDLPAYGLNDLRSDDDGQSDGRWCRATPSACQRSPALRLICESAKFKLDWR